MAGVVSALFLLDIKGRVLVGATTVVMLRHFRLRSSSPSSLRRRFLRGIKAGSVAEWVRFLVIGVRNASTVALREGEDGQKERKAGEVKSGSAGGSGSGGDPDKNENSSYWGVAPSKVTKDDRTEWRCFRPWDTYKADLLINLEKHPVPTTFLDKIAYWTVKALRYQIDVFFQKIVTSISFVGGGGMEEEEEKIVKGDDVIVELDASLEDLYMGGTLKVWREKNILKPAPRKRKCNCRNEVYHRQTGPGMFRTCPGMPFYMLSYCIPDWVSA